MTTDSNTVTRRMTLDVTSDEMATILGALDAKIQYLFHALELESNDKKFWLTRLETVQSVRNMVLEAFAHSVPSEFSGWDSLPAYYQRKGVENA